MLVTAALPRTWSDGSSARATLKVGTIRARTNKSLRMRNPLWPKHILGMTRFVTSDYLVTALVRDQRRNVALGPAEGHPGQDRCNLRKKLILGSSFGQQREG